jgi:Extensin-like protein C-terminus
MFVLVAALAVSSLAAADVPLPRPRPAIPEDAGIVSIETPHGPPTECDGRLAGLAVFEPKPTMAGPGECGGDDLVSLSAVLLPNGRRAEIKPAATLRCEMAESLASWVRDEVAPRIVEQGGELAAVHQLDAYDCRNRDSAAHGKISEHARGKAIDLRGFVLADRSVVTLTDIYAPKELRTIVHDTACRRFMTVLGPGEPYHDDHIHLDVIARRGGHRICSWAVREPPPPVAVAAKDKPAPIDPSEASAQQKAEVDPSDAAPKERHAAVSVDEDQRTAAKSAIATHEERLAEEEYSRPRHRHHKRKRRP